MLSACPRRRVDPSPLAPPLLQVSYVEAEYQQKVAKVESEYKAKLHDALKVSRTGSCC
jgi:hypothetical protein